jgi:hypothetical protein
MSGDDNARTKLIRLTDALMEDIIATPDAEIIAEAGQAAIEQARVIFGKAKMAKTKSDLERRNNSYSKDVVPFDRVAARKQFAKIRTGDAEFERKMTLAARNGEAPTDADIDGLSDDLADLQRLDGEDEKK